MPLSSFFWFFVPLPPQLHRNPRWVGGGCLCLGGQESEHLEQDLASSRVAWTRGVRTTGNGKKPGCPSPPELWIVRTPWAGVPDGSPSARATNWIGEKQAQDTEGPWERACPGWRRGTGF